MLDFSALADEAETYEWDRCRVICGDSCDLDHHLDRDVHLTVTSPPYADAIDYDAHVDDGWYQHTGSQRVTEWQMLMEDVFSALRKQTIDGGYCAVVIGHIRVDGTLVRLPDIFSDLMESIGWQFHEEIIWNKVTGGSARFGTTVQNPYPGYYYPNQQHEYVQIWRNGDDPRQVRDDDSAIEMTEVMKTDVANSVWHIPPVPHNKYDHPAPFPEELVDRLVRCYSAVDDVVCDPFGGLLTTPKVARARERDSVAIELREEYVERGLARLDEEEFERDEMILPQFETTSV